MNFDQIISELIDEGYIQCMTDSQGFTYYWATEGASLAAVVQQHIVKKVINGYLSKDPS